LQREGKRAKLEEKRSGVAPTSENKTPSLKKGDRGGFKEYRNIKKL
jgi:hypothetical protein